MATAERHEWKTELHAEQSRRFWPKEGRHILAQYDRDTVVVYQAYKPAIAEYAVRHQKFGGDHFSFERMSWIKTNFLWMMYRCGWASKNNQEHVLAVRITRSGFEEILANACTTGLQKSKKLTNQEILVRLQWDPDHSPNGERLTRRAIQLGLKDQILKDYGTKWVVQIDDITEFVKEQRKVLRKPEFEGLLTARERVYLLENHSIAYRIQLDVYEDHYRRPVVVQGQMNKGVKTESKTQSKEIASNS